MTAGVAYRPGEVIGRGHRHHWMAYEENGEIVAALYVEGKIRGQQFSGMVRRDGEGWWAAGPKGEREYVPTSLLKDIEPPDGLPLFAELAQLPALKTKRLVSIPSAKADSDELALSTLDRLEAATYDLAGIEKIPPPEYLIDDTLVRDSLTLMFGPPGTKKSFVAQGQALAVAHGIPWMGRDVVAGPVVYVVAEGVSGMGQRVAAWREHHGYPEPLHPVYFIARPVNLFNIEWAAALLEYCVARRPILVIIDTLARCSVGANENESRDMGLIIDNADTIRRATNAAVEIVHHTGKDAGRKGRGSNAFEGAVETEIEVTNTGDTVILKWHKTKDSAEPLPLALRLKVVGTSCVLTIPDAGDPANMDILSSGAMHTLAALRDVEVAGGITATVWKDQAEEAGIARTTFYSHRKQLVDAGLVVDIGTDKRPRYLSKITHEQGEES